MPPDDYPPQRHLLRDLALEIEHGDSLRVRLPVVPEILSDRGSVRAGALAVAADVFAASLAMEELRPDWAVTQEMQLHLLRRASRRPVLVTGTALRAGRTSAVVDVEMRDGEGPALATGTVTFTRISRREDTPVYEPPQEPFVTFATAESGLGAPLLERLGVRTLDADAGALELALSPWVGNSLGALQGGAVVALCEASAESAARAAIGDSVVVTDLAVHFLSLGRVGPMHSRARLLRRDKGRALLRVELVDVGQANRLIALATTGVGSLDG